MIPKHGTQTEGVWGTGVGSILRNGIWLNREMILTVVKLIANEEFLLVPISQTMDCYFCVAFVM